MTDNHDRQARDLAAGISASSPAPASDPQRHRRGPTRRSATLLAALALAGTTTGVAIATSGAAQATPQGFLSQFDNVVPGPSTVPATATSTPTGSPS